MKALVSSDVTLYKNRKLSDPDWSANLVSGSNNDKAAKEERCHYFRFKILQSRSRQSLKGAVAGGAVTC